jgi:CheY-like chemotaxis protein
MNLSASPGSRILVVDDDPDIRELIIAQLERESFAVEAAGCVAEAQAALAAALRRWWCSISTCPMATGWRCAANCAPVAIHRRS